MPAAAHTDSALRVTFSMVWLPATVVMPSRSMCGLPAASRIAIASSWPGSQSRIIFSTRVSFLSLIRWLFTGQLQGLRRACVESGTPPHRGQHERNGRDDVRSCYCEGGVHPREGEPVRDRVCRTKDEARDHR